MINSITVEIKPLSYYNKYASTDYTLCGIDFDITCNGTNHHFYSESSNNCIKKLLSEIDDYLSGKITADSVLCYSIPWIAGDQCMYPYSFQINTADRCWTFRYKRNQNDAEFDFVCDISREGLISMRDQIEEQYSRTDWDSLGKTPLYVFDLPNKDFEWCYSAKGFCKSLNDWCVGKSIKTMYVSAANYADPLHAEENRVNYYVGSELIIQMEDILLDLLIFADGLFKWRVFEKSEYAIIGPSLKFIEDGDKEFCCIGNGYNLLTLNYIDIEIKKVIVKDTEYWAWSAKGFDESKLGDPVELPETILFCLANGCTLSLQGLDDDFAIRLLPSNS